MNELINNLLIFAPLLLVVGLANLAEWQREREEPYQALAITSYLLITAMYLIGILVGIAAQTVGFLLQRQPQLLEEAGIPFQPDSFGILGAGLWVPCLVGLLFLLPPVRRLLARFIAIDPQNPVHAVALAFSMLVIVNLMVTLGVGLANLAELLAEQADAGVTATTTLGLWLQQIFTALLAMVGVGWLTRRNWRNTLDRLGIVVPTGGQILIGLACGLVMVPVIMFVENISTQYNWGVDQSVSDLTEVLLGSLFTTPFGIFTIGASAALGEETIFRGAIQPRFGLILTALLFALVHGNYGLSLSTLIVFLVGLLLGVLRIRYNTTTSMIMHATYNITLAVLAVLGV
ncbi:MAG: CPBP family intramembrane glutamic endopeptidase [Caldilineaceae bacterium]